MTIYSWKMIPIHIDIRAFLFVVFYSIDCRSINVLSITTPPSFRQQYDVRCTTYDDRRISKTMRTNKCLEFISMTIVREKERDKKKKREREWAIFLIWYARYTVTVCLRWRKNPGLACRMFLYLSSINERITYSTCTNIWEFEISNIQENSKRITCHLNYVFYLYIELNGNNDISSTR